MSLSRWGEDGEYFDVTPGYVYVQNGRHGAQFNAPIGRVPKFCEMAMRALEQSGELDEEELEKCEQALRTRFSFTFEGDDE